MSLTSPTRCFDRASVPVGFWDRLTCFRGWLAFYVMLHHVRNGLWPFMRDMSGHEGLWYAWNAATSIVFRFGLHAVFLFFIVSGLSIHFATLSASSSGFTAGSFYRRRLRRLYPALLFSLGFSALLSVLFLGGDMRFELANLLGTLAFQQGVLTECFAGNTPYWSLANEGWYYLFYPLTLWLLFRCQVGAATLLPGSLAVSAVAVFFGLNQLILVYAPVWLSGVWLAELAGRDQKPRAVLVALGWCVVIASLPVTLMHRQSVWLDSALLKTMYGVALVVVVHAWLTSPVPTWLPEWLRKVSHQLGEMSYSLYLNHYLIIEVLARKFPQASQHFGSAMFLSLLALALSLAVAWLSWRLVEMPFLRRRPAVLPQSESNRVTAIAV